MYDVIVIGGGPGGYRAAMELGKHSKSVLLIEKANVGGVCLNEGCIPTKSLLNSSKNGLAQCECQKKKTNDVKKLLSGLSYQFKRFGIAIVIGEAYIEGKRGDYFLVSADNVEYLCKKIIIATGSSNIIPPVPGLKEALDQGVAVDSTAFLKNLNEYPDNVVILGAGVIGIEFATILSNFGKKVVILEKTNNILGGRLGADSVNILSEALKKGNVLIKTGVNIEEIDGNTLIYQNTLSNTFDELSFDLIVIATGRKPNLKSYGLLNFGIDEDGHCLETNEKCETKIPGIYAVGDVNGKAMLAHAAFKESEVAVSNIIGSTESVNYQSMPYVVFSNPEVAFAGLSEKECQSMGLRYYAKKCSMSYSSMYSILNPNRQGLCKLLFDEKDIIIGAELVGNGCSEMIFVLADMIGRSETIDDIRRKIYPHPSLIEVIKEAVNS